MSQIEMSLEIGAGIDEQAVVDGVIQYLKENHGVQVTVNGNPIADVAGDTALAQRNAKKLADDRVVNEYMEKVRAKVAEMPDSVLPVYLQYADQQTKDSRKAEIAIMEMESQN